MQIYYVIHIMKLVKILIIIVIRKNLLSVEYVLFLYFYVILIFFEKNQKYSIYIYTIFINRMRFRVWCYKITRSLKKFPKKILETFIKR